MNKQLRGMEAINKLKVIAAAWKPRTFWSNETPNVMTEREQAILIANKVLDFDVHVPNALYVPGDADCDACILARQYLRVLERLEIRDARPET